MRAKRTNKRRNRRLLVEPLEDRQLLAAEPLGYSELPAAIQADLVRYAEANTKMFLDADANSVLSIFDALNPDQPLASYNPYHDQYGTI